MSLIEFQIENPLLKTTVPDPDFGEISLNLHDGDYDPIKIEAVPINIFKGQGAKWAKVIIVVLMSATLYFLSTDTFGDSFGLFTEEKVDGYISGRKYNDKGKMLTNFAGPMIFGFLDNFGMMIGMEVVENMVKKMGISDSDVIAMLGNTISDGIGALAGGSIGSAITAWTAYDGASSPIMELVGVMLGCLIPPIAKMGGEPTLALLRILMFPLSIPYWAIFRNGKDLKYGPREGHVGSTKIGTSEMFVESKGIKEAGIVQWICTLIIIGSLSSIGYLFIEGQSEVMEIDERKAGFEEALEAAAIRNDYFYYNCS